MVQNLIKSSSEAGVDWAYFPRIFGGERDGPFSYQAQGNYLCQRLLANQMQTDSLPYVEMVLVYGLLIQIIWKLGICPEVRQFTP